MLEMLWLLGISFVFGFILTREINWITLGFGLAVFAVLSIALNTLGLPLIYFVYAILGIIAFAYVVLIQKVEIPKIGFNWFTLVVIGLALVNVYIYWIGATNYPWLEDDDPWSHAIGTMWVQQLYTYSRPVIEPLQRFYLEPYPPAYDVLMGVISQVSGSVLYTLKFYNAFLVGLTLVAAFYAFREMLKDEKHALVATFILFCLPAFMSHFIWAQTLAMLFVFTTLYALEKKMPVAAGISIAAIILTQPTTFPMFLTILIPYLIVKEYKNIKDFNWQYYANIGIIVVAVAILFYVPAYVKFGAENFNAGIGITSSLADDTSGGIVYSLEDYLVIPLSGKIDQLIGIGFVITCLLLYGIWKFEKQEWCLYTVAALLLAFLGTEGNALPLKLFPHRFWVFLAIPVAILAGYGLIKVYNNTLLRRLICIALIGMIIYESAIPKFMVETAIWSPGDVFKNQQELSDYILYDKIPENSSYNFCKETGNFQPCLPKYSLLIGKNLR